MNKYEEAINFLKGYKLSELYDTKIPFKNSFTTMKEQINILEEATKQLKQKNMELKHNEWISVDNKLPEQGQCVEICKIVTAQAIYEPEENQFYSWKLCGEDEPFRRCNECVSHWKAL